MNVEIGAEAAQFPEKEYIYTELPLQYSSCLRTFGTCYYISSFFTTNGDTRQPWELL